MGLPSEILSIRDLSIGFITGRKRQVIFSGLNLSAFEGELVALAGPNGMGKSTLLRTISRLQTILSGEILIDGRLINSMDSFGFSRLVSFVSTEMIQVERMTVYDLVSLGRFPYTNWIGKLGKADRQMVEHSLEITGLKPLSGNYITELSDGERQKAMIARAIAQDTKIILLDEPTAFLDIENKSVIISILQQLTREKNKTIIFSVHDINMAIHAADRFWLLGRNSHFEGAPEDMILAGAFSSLFDKEKVKFNEMSGEFGTRYDVPSGITVEGQGLPYFWTVNALSRLGLQPDEINDRVLIRIEQLNGKSTWIALTSQTEKRFNSIYELCNFISLNIKIYKNG
ncbi:MAG: ABC transporter ATP-binding protein [Bacteroidia bacterium]|nr:ABC transporter ATP-binding protein [Bacteroidia bacterium]